MQKKRSTLKFPVLFGIVVSGSLFLFMACGGRSVQTQQPSVKTQQEISNEEVPVLDWNPNMLTKTTFTFTSQDVINYFKANKINIAIFGSEDMGYKVVWVKNYEQGTEVEPCLKPDDLMPGGCNSFGGGFKYKGKDSILYLRTKKNPNCVAVSIGGYIFQFDPKTGGPCP